MRDLVDTNVWLAPLLHQTGEVEAAAYLAVADDADLAITDFAQHSVAVECDRRALGDDYLRWVDDVLILRSITVLALPADAAREVAATQRALRLSYDDAYQATVARRENRRLVSLDRLVVKRVPGAIRPRDAMPSPSPGRQP